MPLLVTEPQQRCQGDSRMPCVMHWCHDSRCAAAYEIKLELGLLHVPLAADCAV